MPTDPSPAPVLRSPFLWAGLLLYAACAAAWGLLWTADPRAAAAVAGTFGAFLLGGKLAAVPVGFALHLNPFVIGATVLVPDIATLLFFYPLTRTSLDLLGRWSGLVRRLEARAAAAAANRDGLIAKYGASGLFVMSLSPIGVYSPVVSAIGQLMGLSGARVLVPIVAALLATTAILVVAVGQGFLAAARIDARLPLWLAAALLVAVLLVDVVRRVRRAAVPDDPA